MSHDDQSIPAGHQKEIRLSKISDSGGYLGYLFITPNFFNHPPLHHHSGVFCLLYQLTNWNILSDPNFVGFANYEKIFQDKVARETFFNTFYFTVVSVPLNVAITLVLAVFLNQKLRGITFFRTAYYLPVISASVAISLMFMWILANNGLLNQMFESIGLEPVRWLTDPKIALNSVIGVTIWKGLGMNMIIFLAACRTFPMNLSKPPPLMEPPVSSGSSKLSFHS